MASPHPGGVLRSRFMEPMGLSAYAMANALGVSRPTVNELVRERKSVTPALAIRLGRFLGTGPEFWLRLQHAFDLDALTGSLANDLDNIDPNEVPPMAPRDTGYDMIQLDAPVDSEIATAAVKKLARALKCNAVEVRRFATHIVGYSLRDDYGQVADPFKRQAAREVLGTVIHKMEAEAEGAVDHFLFEVHHKVWRIGQRMDVDLHGKLATESFDVRAVTFALAAQHDITVHGVSAWDGRVMMWVRYEPPPALDNFKERLRERLLEEQEKMANPSTTNTTFVNAGPGVQVNTTGGKADVTVNNQRGLTPDELAVVAEVMKMVEGSNLPATTKAEVNDAGAMLVAEPDAQKAMSFLQKAATAAGSVVELAGKVADLTALAGRFMS